MNKLFSECRRAALQNLKPGIGVFVIALSLVFSYYNSPSVQASLSDLMEVKAQNRYLFSGFSTMIFAALLPYIFLCLSKRLIFHPKVLLFMLIFWFWKGSEIELFYSFQADVFGTGTDFATIAKKVLVDQFIFSTIYAVPCIVIVYAWKEVGFSYTLWKREINKELFRLKIPTVIMSNMMIWLPSCAVIYSMPTPLQVPLSNLIGFFFVLMIEVLTTKKD
jgi:hypothetical protein